MKTDTPQTENVPAVVQPPLVRQSSDTPETDEATLKAADIEGGGEFEAVHVQVSKRLERERDETRKKLSHKTQTWIMAEGTIREQFQRIARLEVELLDLKRSAEMNEAIWEESRQRTTNITRKCCDAMGVLRRGGEDQAMLAVLQILTVLFVFEFSALLSAVENKITLPMECFEGGPK